MVVSLASAAGEARSQTLLWKHAGGVFDRMGDFDGDGIVDVVIADDPLRVVSGKDGSDIGSIPIPSSFGSWSVAGVGDQDGDGVPDVLFGFPDYFNIHGNTVGQVYGISGATGATFYFDEGRDFGAIGYDYRLGCCVRGLGDANADGLPDFGYGIQGPDAPYGGASEVRVRFTGGGTGVDSTLAFFFDTTVPNHALAPVGDVDGDGGSDFVAGTKDRFNVGAVDVRSGKSGSLIRTIVGNAASDGFATTLGACGDLDGDGVRDILVGAPLHKVGGHATGSVMIYSGATGAFLRQLDGAFDQQHFGADVDGLDDLDGDGVADFVVASSDSVHGRVQLFSGASGAELQRIDGEPAALVRNVGDLDGDGVSDFVSGYVDTHAWSTALTPSITSVTPTRSRYDRVGQLSISGGGFIPDPSFAVTINGVPATGITIQDVNDLTCTAPALLPGMQDVTIADRYGSATLAGAIELTPALFVDGVATLGASVDLRYEFDPFDSTFAIYGLPPQQSIPTPPFGGLLGVVPFTPFFLLNSWPSDQFIVHAQIPNDPALSGVTVLFQSLTGPRFFGHGKDAAWSNVGVLAIQ
jgi:hypothetical protein